MFKKKISLCKNTHSAALTLDWQQFDAGHTGEAADGRKKLFSIHGDTQLKTPVLGIIVG